MASDDQLEIPHLDVTIDPTKVETEFFQVLEVIRPKWEKEQVEFKESAKGISGGLLNTMVTCYSSTDPMDAIMIRIHNPEVSLFIERSIEVTCIKHLHKTLDCAPKILAIFKNGFCYEFIHGELLNVDRLTEEPIWSLIAEELAKFHSARILDGKNLNGEPQTRKMMEMMWAKYPEEMKDPEKNKKFKAELPDKEILKKELEFLYDHLMQFNPTVVLCHHDTRPENIIWNPDTGVLKFIDFEAMNYAYQAGELAAHFSRFTGLPLPDFSKYPSEEFQMKWLRVYLRKYYECKGRNADDVTDKDVRRLYVLVNKFYAFFLICAGIAGPPMEEKEFFAIDAIDFLQFAIDHVNEYFKRKDEILNMEMPPE